MKTVVFIFIQIIFTAAFAQDLQQHLLLRYPFDGNANDISVNGYNATPVNVTYTEDRFGNAMSSCHFNGINSYVNFPNVSELKPELPVSFSFWVKYESNAYQQQVIFNTSMEENHATSVVFNSTADTGHYVTILQMDLIFMVLPAGGRMSAIALSTQMSGTL